MKHRLQAFQHQFLTFKTRQEQLLCWYPYPVIIPFLLATILSGIVLGTLNYRRGMAANLMHLEAEPTAESTIWFAISLQQDQLLITSSKREHILLPKKIKSAEDMAPFSELLKRNATKVLYAATLARSTTSTKLSVTLAVDERLRYAHIQPLIQVLAEQGISNYGFETQTIKKAEKESTSSTH